MCEEKESPPGGNRAGNGRGNSGQLSASQHTTPRADCQVEIVYDLPNGFVMIDARFYDLGYAATLGGNTANVYATLLRHARAGRGDVWPSYGRIADRSGVSYRTAMTSIAALEALGLIRVTREPGRCSVITILPAEQWHASGVYIDARGREVGLDVAAVRAGWKDRRRGRPPAEAGNGKPPRNSRTFSENPREIRVPTPANFAHEQEQGNKNQPSEQEPTSSCVLADDALPAGLQNDDDASIFGTETADFEPEPENTAEPADESPQTPVVEV